MTFENKPLLRNLYIIDRNNIKHLRSKRKQKRKPKRKQATRLFETHCISMFIVAFAYIIVACLPAAP